ncbi:hypothetical protein [Clostridium beijerinckii]|uniref:Uncharacterized protein n=1 Tax=Clostridium beijerinckii TaxID=1520 RepID=A0AAE5H0U1_CLOBE|nr:hypothetical protein [Clostridium beijerinckii]NSB12105.1 hypothetical protein [Clostridium beijerinckii]OOM27439.1 hypothetical protein CLOBE_29970 [Clostridium beijerinckii]
MYKFDYDIDNYTLYGDPCKVTEMLADCDSRTDYSIEDKVATHEEYDGYEKFYATWGVHKENEWTGMLILDVSKLDGSFIIATGIGY